MTIEKRHKLQWYCHVSHSSGPAKTILQGTVKGGRWQGRQRKRWEDNIKEWTGLEFAKSQKAAENREKCRELVVQSSVVPQWPLRLSGSWWWWWPSQTCKTEIITSKEKVQLSVHTICHLCLKMTGKKWNRMNHKGSNWKGRMSGSGWSMHSCTLTYSRH